jgi:hypothetical protein
VGESFVLAGVENREDIVGGMSVILTSLLKGGDEKSIEVLLLAPALVKGLLTD